MTISEDTRAALSEQTTKIADALNGKDMLAMDLAKSLETKDLLLKTALKTGEDIQAEYDKHMLDAHPVVAPAPTPAPAPVKTLFGMGGGNVQRNGMDLDRRYYGPSGKAQSIRDINTNEAKGIVSWVSYKCPFSWAEMAKGAGNAWAKDLFTGLITEVKPAQDDADQIDKVLVSIHHEPEGDGDEDLWREFQGQLAPLVPGGPAGPLKFFLTTTGWGQEFNAQRIAAEVDWETNLFPVDQIDFIAGIGYDSPYNTYGYEWVDGVKTTTMNTSWTDPYTYIDALARRGVQFDCDVAVGEWGYSDEAFLKDKTWALKVMDRMQNNPIKPLVAAAYFDTKLNSKRSWWLGGPDAPKRNYMNALINNRRAA